jgi:hypothetical protein
MTTYLVGIRGPDAGVAVGPDAPPVHLTTLSRSDSGASNIAYAPVRRLVDVSMKKSQVPFGYVLEGQCPARCT